MRKRRADRETPSRAAARVKLFARDRQESGEIEIGDFRHWELH
jgi:hypothetical protein